MITQTETFASQLLEPESLAVETNPLTIKSVDDWVSDIKRLYGKGTSSILELAKFVVIAKISLPYGTWGRLWKSESDRLPFSKSKADRLALIGEKLAHIDSETSPKLPWGWNILYQLALLDRFIFDQLVRGGTIHAKLTYREAKELVAKFRGQRSSESSTKSNVKLRLQRFREFVESTLPNWSANERVRVRQELIQMAQQIGAQRGRPANEGTYRAGQPCRSLPRRSTTLALVQIPTSPQLREQFSLNQGSTP